MTLLLSWRILSFNLRKRENLRSKCTGKRDILRAIKVIAAV